LSAWRNSLQFYELSQLSHAANLRKEMTALMDQWIVETSAAMLARWLMEHRQREAATPPIENERREGGHSVSDNIFADAAGVLPHRKSKFGGSSQERFALWSKRSGVSSSFRKNVLFLVARKKPPRLAHECTRPASFLSLVAASRIPFSHVGARVLPHRAPTSVFETFYGLLDKTRDSTRREEMK